MAPSPLPDKITGGSPFLNDVLQKVSDGNLDAVKQLLRGTHDRKEFVKKYRIDGGGMEGLTALHIAACRGRTEVCSYLVNQLQVDVDITDSYGRTPFLLAVIFGKYDTATYLLKCWANPEKATHDGLAPLHHATVSGDSDMIKFLLTSGAPVDQNSPYGMPLHIAASKGDFYTVELLLKKNASYNRAVNGVTPLISAINSNSWKCGILLVEAGADVSEALLYSANNLSAAKIISKEFHTCLAEHVADKRVFPRLNEPRVKTTIRLEGFKTLASVAVHVKKYTSAISCCTKILEFDPDNEYAKKAQDLLMFKKIAFFCFKCKYYSEAQKMYRERIYVDYEGAAASLFSDWSLCFMRLEDGKNALEAANECRRRRPDWPKACYRQGAALMLLEDYESAYKRFSEGLDMDPENIEIQDALRVARERWESVTSLVS